jgi:hypothetical protein
MANSTAIRFLVWFLADMPYSIWLAGKNLLIWCWRFFSIGFFLPRIFSPWHKDITSYGRGFDFKAWGHAFVWNFISRIIGAILRLFFICCGAVLEVIIFASMILVLAFWCLLPVIIIYLIFSGWFN